MDVRHVVTLNFEVPGTYTREKVEDKARGYLDAYFGDTYYEVSTIGVTDGTKTTSGQVVYYDVEVVAYGL